MDKLAEEHKEECEERLRALEDFDNSSPHTLRIAQLILDKLFTQGLCVDRPGIYALFGGGVLLEWARNGIDWSVEIPDASSVRILGLNKVADIDVSITQRGTELEVASSVLNTLSENYEQ